MKGLSLSQRRLSKKVRWRKHGTHWMRCSTHGQHSSERNQRSLESHRLVLLEHHRYRRYGCIAKDSQPTDLHTTRAVLRGTNINFTYNSSRLNLINICVVLTVYNSFTFILYMWVFFFLCMSIYMCAVPSEAITGHWIPPELELQPFAVIKQLISNAIPETEPFYNTGKAPLWSRDSCIFPHCPVQC